jgi:hypothetical protein
MSAFGGQADIALLRFRASSGRPARGDTLASEHERQDRRCAHLRRIATGLLDSFRLSAQIIQQDINADQEDPKRQYKEAQIDVIAAD